MQDVLEFRCGCVQTLTPDFERRSLIFTCCCFPKKTNQKVTSIDSRRDLLEQICEVSVNVTAEEFVNVETFTIKIRQQRQVFLTRCLQESADEKRTAGKLLYEQIACGFAGFNVLPPSDMFDQPSSFIRVQPFETQHVQKFKVALRIVRSFEDLTTQ